MYDNEVHGSEDISYDIVVSTNVITAPLTTMMTTTIVAEVCPLRALVLTN